MFTLVLIAGAIALTVLAVKKFWESLVKWLNTYAADAVEKHLGIKARNNMLRAVAAIDRIADKVRNISTVFSRTNPITVNKTTLKQEAYASSFDNDVLKELDKGPMTQEIAYTK